MPTNADLTGADSICVYGGQTATDLVGCINKGDDFESLTLVSIEAQRLPTQQILIEFNGATWGTLHEVEVDYYYKSKQII
mgnify:CR=1 FL=1